MDALAVRGDERPSNPTERQMEGRPTTAPAVLVLSISERWAVPNPHSLCGLSPAQQCQVLSKTPCSKLLLGTALSFGTPRGQVLPGSGLSVTAQPSQQARALEQS